MKTVILAAGFGSRLRPVSTSERPKQFQPLIEGKSLLRYTYDTLNKVTPRDELYVLGLDGMTNLILEQVPELPQANIILVPERRNTLPHTLWTLTQITDDSDEPVLFRSVDHYLPHPETFLESLKNVLNNYQPTTNITLLCPIYDKFNSNDGYAVTDEHGSVLKFLEKPTEQEVSELANGRTVYRSPFIYIATKNSMLSNLQGLDETWATSAQAILTEKQLAAKKDAFLNMPVIDLSSSIFQKAKHLRVAQITYEFIDVGRFEELYKLNAKDTSGNAVLGKAILTEDCKNNLVINTTDRPIVVINKQSTVIVQTNDGSLISTFADASRVGEIYKTQIHKH